MYGLTWSSKFCDKSTFILSKVSQQSRGNIWAGQKKHCFETQNSLFGSIASHIPLFLENKRELDSKIFSWTKSIFQAKAKFMKSCHLTLKSSHTIITMYVS